LSKKPETQSGEKKKKSSKKGLENWSLAQVVEYLLSKHEAHTSFNKFALYLAFMGHYYLVM
jgi:hypothetical protein